SEIMRIWCGDIEHHITADVAYAVYQYWQVTGDDEFMRDYGAEIILDTARFWGSRAEWNEAKGRYEINDVIGPDEYHEHVDNNAYTNNLARLNLRTAFGVLDWLRKTDPRKAKELEGRLDLSPQRLAHWQDVRDRIYLGFDPRTELFEQFEGFFKLKNADLNSFEPRTKSMQAILGMEGVQAYQVIKQPDVLMLLYLLRDEYDLKILKKNWSYYTQRTDLTYGSSLGPSIHAVLAARLGDIPAAYHHFIHAARTDLEDVRGNTAEGIHAATDGGLWQAVVFGFGGLEIVDGKPATTPRLPDHWKRLKFRIQYHGKPYDFDLQHLASETTRGPSSPVLGAIFDLDGVLTDTSELHYLAWQRLADEEGIPFNRQENEALRGIPRRESLLLLLKGRTYPEEALQEMMDRKNRYYVESIARLNPENLLPGARRFLEDLRQAGVKIAIGSASKNAWAVMERLGIAGLVDATSDGHSVTRQKPEPDLFLHAAAQLGLPPEQCVVFEDAEAGVAAGLASGTWVVGIGPRERVGAAHVILPSLEGVTWLELLEQLTQAHSARLAGQ
ncbi:MAG TPA: beta-phosphoglucomutase, partial [Thermodesulfobacteriota bacterium]|nr:beta-phosphoglucomutase [Thermodesulfobacteriota bacterium]